MKYFLFYKPYQVLSQFSPEPGKETLSDYLSLPKDVYPVVTRAKAKVGIQMSDGASFFVSQNASLEIRPGSQYYQTDGAISMLFRKSGRDTSGKWAIKTPVVTAGVRGTGFTVEASKSQTRLVLFPGQDRRSPRWDNLQY